MGFTDFVGVEDDVEWFGEGGFDCPILINVDLDEESLVAEPAGLVVASGVDAGDVRSELKTVVDVESRFGVIVVVFGEPGVDVIALGTELVLLGFELFEAGRVGEVCVEEAVLFGEVSVSPGGEFGSFGSGGGRETVELEVQRFARHVDRCRWDAYVSVVVADKGFDISGMDCFLTAISDALVPAGADKVWIDCAAA